MTEDLPEPSFQRSHLSCLACSRDWLEHTPIDVALPLWIAFMSAIRCPRCGGSSIRFGFAAAPEQSDSPAHAARSAPQDAHP